MIVRILGEGQFEVESSLADRINAIDNKIVEHVNKGDRKEFKKDLARMISTIKEKGEPIDPVDILPSDIIVPPGDLTLEEARKVFRGEGLIED
jgi:3',5'-cyclic AMP phosphodiesterase CpdA